MKTTTTLAADFQNLAFALGYTKLRAHKTLPGAMVLKAPLGLPKALMTLHEFAKMAKIHAVQLTKGSVYLMLDIPVENVAKAQEIMAVAKKIGPKIKPYYTIKGDPTQEYAEEALAVAQAPKKVCVHCGEGHKGKGSMCKGCQAYIKLL